ncbi:hypothetical protein [Polymorphospora sp. NPDC050346]|uniref:hypothetical protein n=1 Tax=Polymorphospora sp. NPDC050346 TaxID=3155780 RepID=UPI0033F7469E
MGLRALGRVAGAELGKLGTLPAVRWTVAGTVGASALLSAAVTNAALGRSGMTEAGAAETGAAGAVDVAAAALQSVGLVQIGLVLLGILAVSSEYADGQIATSLASVPDRMLFLIGKTVAWLGAALGTALLGVATSYGAAYLVVRLDGAPARDGGEVVRAHAGAVGYLVLIGLLAYATAFLLRNAVATVATTLTLVLLVSPYLARFGGAARFLPDIAGKQAFHLGSLPPGALSPGTGILVLLGWCVALLLLTGVTFRRRDAG